MNRKLQRLEWEYDFSSQSIKTDKIVVVAKELQYSGFLGNTFSPSTATIDDFVEIVDSIPKTPQEIDDYRTDCCFCGLDIGTAETDDMLAHFYKAHPKDMNEMEKESDRVVARAEEEQDRREMDF